MGGCYGKESQVEPYIEKFEKRLADLENNQKANDNKENEINKISLLEKQFNVLQNQYQSILDSINSLSTRLDKLENESNIPKESEIKTAINTVTVLNKSISNIKTKFENRIIQMNKRITVLEKPNSELEEKINKVEEKVNSIENKIEKLKNTRSIQSFTSTLIMSQISDFITDQDLSTETTLSQSIYIYIYIMIIEFESLCKFSGSIKLKQNNYHPIINPYILNNDIIDNYKIIENILNRLIETPIRVNNQNSNNLTNSIGIDLSSNNRNMNICFYKNSYHIDFYKKKFLESNPITLESIIGFYQSKSNRLYDKNKNIIVFVVSLDSPSDLFKILLEASESGQNIKIIHPAISIIYENYYSPNCNPHILNRNIFVIQLKNLYCQMTKCQVQNDGNIYTTIKTRYDITKYQLINNICKQLKEKDRKCKEYREYFNCNLEDLVKEFSLNDPGGFLEKDIETWINDEIQCESKIDDVEILILKNGLDCLWNNSKYTIICQDHLEKGALIYSTTLN